MNLRKILWIVLGAGALLVIGSAWILRLPAAPAAQSPAAPPVAREKAEAVGRELGLANWDARHDSDAFAFTRPFALTVLGNKLAFWKHQQLGMALVPGIDEVSLALVADAWSRTYRSQVVTFAGTEGAVETRNGLRILPDQITADWPPAHRLQAIGDRPPAKALDQALQTIEARYGDRTADIVAMQLEYPR